MKNVKFPTIHRLLTAFERLSCLVRADNGGERRSSGGESSGHNIASSHCSWRPTILESPDWPRELRLPRPGETTRLPLPLFVHKVAISGLPATARQTHGAARARDGAGLKTCGDSRAPIFEARVQNPRFTGVRGAPGGRACSRGFPPSLRSRPRPKGRCVPRFRNGAATCFIVFKNYTAARAARRAPSPPRSRGVTVLPFPNFAFICERGAVKTTPLMLLFFLLAPESWCPRRPPGSVPNAPVLRCD